MEFIRADILIIKQEKAESRTVANELIREGLVQIGGKVISKPATLVPRNSIVTLLSKEPRYVSRGGIKLAGALSDFKLNISGKIALDSGASTGGFTDCLLQSGASKVYAIDVGYGQLHWKLRQDQRVIVFEKTNLRYLSPDKIPDPIDLVTLDLSFISVKLVLPSVEQVMGPHCIILVLLKPQFEAGKGKAGFKGVIRNREDHRDILSKFIDHVYVSGWAVKGIAASHLVGPKGNREFFVLMDKEMLPTRAGLESMIDSAVD
jgi:23S rRNA (cytidine1920-2'-O)/16S rRNA (cytidine1409-2'-O)-methyltransferase